jgi:glucosamine--fructose-6-phosphate aminotransferase (isomerizing)
MEMDDFKHKMLQDIYKGPVVIEKTLKFCMAEIPNFLPEIVQDLGRMIYITGSGTSYHAGLAGQYALSALAGLPTSLIPASEVAPWIPRSKKGFLLIAFSQSGESVDILHAAKFAVERGAKVLAITNQAGSQLARFANYSLITQAGEEIAVTATKTYLGQLSAIYALSIELGLSLKVPLDDNLVNLKESIQSAPKMVYRILESQNGNLQKISLDYMENTFFFLLGSGPNFATALEGALKFKESCNLFAEGHSTREFLHGPMQLINEKTPMFFLVSEHDNIVEWRELITRFKGFGAPIILVSCRNEEIEEKATNIITLPQGIPQIFSPIYYVVPLQLFAYYSSITRGLNPDKPEKLTKVVK